MRDIDWEEVEKLRVELGELIDRDDLPSEHHGKFSRISKILSQLDEINTGTTNYLSFADMLKTSTVQIRRRNTQCGNMSKIK